MSEADHRESSRPELIKRIFVGRSMASGRMEHTLLPKILALPIFASDALSSVAYSVEASLLILVLASSNVRRFIIPINLAVAAVMAIVVTSYRQVVRAYPTSAGSYVVSSENLATIFGLIAGAALLTDYVLTVAVSVSSGVFAISSAMNGSLNSYIVEISIVCVVLLTVVNLRGVRESGLAFATPTYVFIVSIFALIVVGFAKCLGGCPAVTHVPHPVPYGPAATVGLFAILHSFASGSSALTGTEAISNGVSAFRRPQGHNAAQTLSLLGVIAVTMIMGIAFLAFKTGARPSETVSVLSEIARAVFPGSSPSSGGFMFWVVQISTFAVLILAANTSYQGFPRLAALLARDRFIPSQFENLGDRLVYSNGMVVLAGFAILLVWAFHANVDRLLQLYVVGVFTAFTLSQAGMVRYWLRAAREGGPRAEGWHWRLTINAVGAIATGVVLVIVVLTKFTHGAWIVLIAIPVMITGFYAVHRHYANVSRQLRAGTVSVEVTLQNTVVVYVEELNEATAEAVGYVRTFRGNDFRAIHVEGPGSSERVAGWSAFCRADVELEVLPAHGHPTAAVVDFVKAIPRRPEDFVTIVVPERLAKRSLLSALRRRTTFYLKVRLLNVPGVVVADVPVLAQARPAEELAPMPLMPQRTEAIVLVSAVHDGTVRAVNYARSLRATETRALFVALDHTEVAAITAAWDERRIPVQLDVVEAPFRELGVPILNEIRRVTSRPGSVAAVVIPEVVVRRWWQHLLHGQRALFIKRLLLFEDRVILSSVPYQIR
jgi:amino acid transporter